MPTNHCNTEVKKFKIDLHLKEQASKEIDPKCKNP